MTSQELYNLLFNFKLKYNEDVIKIVISRNNYLEIFGAYIDEKSFIARKFSRFCGISINVDNLDDDTTILLTKNNYQFWFHGSKLIYIEQANAHTKYPELYGEVNYPSPYNVLAGIEYGNGQVGIAEHDTSINNISCGMMTTKEVKKEYERLQKFIGQTVVISKLVERILK